MVLQFLYQVIIFLTWKSFWFPWTKGVLVTYLRGTYINITIRYPPIMVIGHVHWSWSLGHGYICHILQGCILLWNPYFSSSPFCNNKNPFFLSFQSFFLPCFILCLSVIFLPISLLRTTNWTHLLISQLILFSFFFISFSKPHCIGLTYPRECKFSSPVRELYPCDAVGLGENTLSSRPHPHHKVIQYLYTAWVSTQLTSKYSGAQKTTLPPPPHNYNKTIS